MVIEALSATVTANASRRARQAIEGWTAKGAREGYRDPLIVVRIVLQALSGFGFYLKDLSAMRAAGAPRLAPGTSSPGAVDVWSSHRWNRRPEPPDAVQHAITESTSAQAEPHIFVEMGQGRVKDRARGAATATHIIKQIKMDTCAGRVGEDGVMLRTRFSATTRTRPWSMASGSWRGALAVIEAEAGMLGAQCVLTTPTWRLSHDRKLREGVTPPISRYGHRAHAQAKVVGRLSSWDQALRDSPPPTGARCQHGAGNTAPPWANFR